MRLAGFLCLCDRLYPGVAFAVQAVDVVLGGENLLAYWLGYLTVKNKSVKWTTVFFVQPIGV